MVLMGCKSLTYSSVICGASSDFFCRYSVGDMPVKRLNAVEKWGCDEKPTLYAICEMSTSGCRSSSQAFLRRTFLINSLGVSPNSSFIFRLRCARLKPTS